MATAIVLTGWAWVPNALFQIRRKIRNRVWPGNPGAVCIDIGCGSGLTSIEKAMKWPHTVFYCVDIRERELKKGILLAKALGLPNIQFVKADASRLPFKREAADSIIAANMMTDVPDIVTTLKDWANVLKECSTLIIETPLKPQRLFLFKIGAVRKLLRSHVNAYQGFIESELEAFLASVGLMTFRKVRVFQGIGVLARELHYILMAINPFLSAISWVPLYLMMRLGAGKKSGNAVTLLARVPDVESK